MIYYILCPGDKETGGSELAHQLCHLLVQMGHQAYMYYTRSGQAEPWDVEACEKYKKYQTDHVKYLSEMKYESVVIVPETLTSWMPALLAGRKVIWWMSVDGYIQNTGEKNLRIIADSAAYHLVQSYYVKHYLLERANIPEEKILFVSDYIGDSYGQFLLPGEYRKDIVLYNPAKGYEDLQPLMEIVPWVQWVPLEGLTEEQMIVKMQMAKAYVDFGSHPGKDRIPREAASCGCCVITNRKGAASFDKDVPIPEKYKFQDVHQSYEEIAGLIGDICCHYETHVKNFADYRRWISGEKEKFAADVETMTEVLQSDFSLERKNVLLLTTISRYGSSDRYVCEWAAALRKFGCNTCILDGWSLAHPTRYHYVLENYRFDLVLDLNGEFCSLNITKELFPQTIYGIYVCDPPVCIRENLGRADERTIVFCCDKHFRDYTKQYFPMVKHVEFVPLSGSASAQYIPYEERTFEIVFTGTYQDPRQIKEELMAKFESGGVLELFLNDMLEDIIVHSQHTLADCLAATLAKYEQRVSDAEFHELMGEFWKVDFYARFYYREKVIRTLLEAGLQIHVFGNGWENFHSEYVENLVIHKGGAYAAEKALANAKIALNIMPWFKDAFQERIASAMLSRAVAVTDESRYMNDYFENNRELIVFSLKEIDRLPERIGDLLNNPLKAAEMAENGYQKVQRHTWTVRVADMLQKIEEHFGVSFVQEGEGEEMEFGLEYPSRQVMLLDAIYELKKMAKLAEQDVGKIESLSGMDIEFLMKKFNTFVRQFSKHLPGIEMDGFIRNSLQYPQGDRMTDMIELFSVQCKALMGELLLEEKGVRI